MRLASLHRLTSRIPNAVPTHSNQEYGDIPVLASFNLYEPYALLQLNLPWRNTGADGRSGRARPRLPGCSAYAILRRQHWILVPGRSRIHPGRICRGLRAPQKRTIILLTRCWERRDALAAYDGLAPALLQIEEKQLVLDAPRQSQER